MANYYNMYNGIQPFNDTIHLNGPAPLDDREVFSSVDGLYFTHGDKNHPLFNRAYKGMQVVIFDGSASIFMILNDATPYSANNTTVNVTAQNYLDYWAILSGSEYKIVKSDVANAGMISTYKLAFKSPNMKEFQTLEDTVIDIPKDYVLKEVHQCKASYNTSTNVYTETSYPNDSKWATDKNPVYIHFIWQTKDSSIATSNTYLKVADVIKVHLSELNSSVNTLETHLKTVADPSISSLERHFIDVIDPSVSALETHFSIVVNPSINKLETRLGKADTSIGILNSSVSTLETHISKTDVSVSTLNSSVNKLEIRVGKVDTSIGTLNSSVSTLETHIRKTDTSINTINSSVNKLETHLEKTDSSIVILNSSVSTLETHISKTDSSISTLNSSVNVLENHISKTDTSINTINSSVNKLETHLEKTDSSIVILNSSVSSLETHISKTDSSVSTLNSSLNELNTSLGQLYVDFESFSDDVTSSIHDLNSSYNNLVDEIIANEEVVAAAFNTINSSVNVLETSLEKTDSSIVILNSSVSNLETYIINTDISTLDSSLNELNTSLGQLYVDFESFSDDVTSSIHTLNSSYNNLVDEIIANEEVVAAALTDLNDRIDVLKENSSTYVTTIDNFSVNHNSDLDFADSSGNVIMRLQNGQIQTKEFNSTYASKVLNVKDIFNSENNGTIDTISYSDLYNSKLITVLEDGSYVSVNLGSVRNVEPEENMIHNILYYDYFDVNNDSTPFGRSWVRIKVSTLDSSVINIVNKSI